MRRARLTLLYLLCLPLIALFTGCGSTTSGGFTLSADSSVTIAQGTSKTFTVTPTASGNFTGSVTITASGLPTGVTLSPASASIAVGSSATFTLTASSTATVGTSTVTLTGTSGSASETTTVSLTVTAASGGTPDFSFSISPTTMSLDAGKSGTVTLTATALNGFTGTVGVTLSGLAAGVTASPSTITVTPGTPTTVTLAADDTVATTTAAVPVSFLASSGALSHKATLSLSLTGTGTTGSGDFALALSPTSISLTAGGSPQTVLASITASNGFTGPVTVTWGTPSSGVSVDNTTESVVAGTPQAFRFTAAATAAGGTTSVTLTGTAGSLTHSVQLKITVVASQAAPDFSLALTPPSLTVAPGSVSMATISATPINSYNGTITVATGGLPVGVSISQPSFNLVPGTPVSLTFTIDPSAAAGTSNITFLGISGTLSHTVTLALTITKASSSADFGLTLSPATLNVAQGAIGQSTISASALNGFTGSISVTASGVPNGITLSQSNFTLSTSTPQALTLTIAANATPGTYSIVLTGTSGNLTHATSLTVTITPAGSGGDFALTLTPSTMSIAQGNSGSTSLLATAGGGFTDTINVTASGVPSGVTLSPSSFSVSAGGSQVLTLTVAANATPGTYTIGLTGTSGKLTHAASLTVTITQPGGGGDFALALAPPTISVTQGSSGSVSMSATASGGFTGTIQVIPGALPAGVVLTPASSFNLTPGTPQTVTVAAASTTPSGTYTINFTGTNGTLTHTVSLTLTVNSSSSTADFSLAATPNPLAVAQGDQNDLITLSITGTGGFNGNVSFTVSGLPSGVTAVPPSGSLTAGNSEPIGFSATDSVTIGTYTVTITGTSGSLTHSTTVTLNVTAPPPPDVVTVTLTPSSLTVPIGSIGQVSVTATGPSGYTGDVTVTISGLPTGVTTNPTKLTLASGASQTVVFTAAANATLGSSTVTFTGKVGSINGTATLNLLIVQQPNAGYDVPTWHYDISRSGLNAFETALTPATVTPAKFGKLTSYAADANVDAQPLYISNLKIGSQTHNVLYVATENDTVYAYDADSGSVLWQASVLGSNETASDDHGCSAITPKIGITSTPVIDRSYLSNGAIFLVAMTKDSNGDYHQRLHALDLTTGAELSGSPTEIAATTTQYGATNTFTPSLFVERSALLLNSGTIYLTWAAPCQQTTFDYDGWIMAYSEATLQQQSALDMTPNGSGGAIWMSGAGPAADTQGFVFFATAKGTFDTNFDGNGYPANGDYGNSYLKVQNSNGVLSVYDYFEPAIDASGSVPYLDLGSGGVMVLPDIPVGTNGNVLSLLIGAGKDGNIYEMGHVGSNLGEFDNNFRTISSALPNGASSSPAYFNKLFYYGGIGDSLKSFDATDPFGSIVSQSQTTLGTEGATPVITANGTSTAILWALDTGATGGPVLHAYDATDLTNELYNSAQAQTNGVSRDTVGATGKYTVPVVINGHVYVGTQTGVDVYGLLP